MKAQPEAEPRSEDRSEAPAIAPEEEGQLQLVVFEVAGIRYAADLTQVLRLDFFDPKCTVGAPLGTPRSSTKGLMIDAQDGQEWCLGIDLLHGVKAVPIEQLRRLPPLAQGGRIPIGAWLDGGEAVLLVDLAAMTVSKQ